MSLTGTGPIGALRQGGALDGFWRRCADTVERRGSPSGTVVLLDDAERAAVGRVLGRRLQPSVRQVRVAELDAFLRGSPLDAGLPDLLPELLGQRLRNHPEERRALRRTADRIWAEAAVHPAVGTHPRLEDWLTRLRRSGTLSRLAPGAEGPVALARALDVLAALPTEQPQLLAVLATRVLRTPHALDPGTPTSTLVLGALARLEDSEVRGAGDRRRLWERFGVVCDRLSSTVLTLNLRASAPAPLAAVLAAGADAGVPMCLTLDQLERWSQDARWEARVVFACENPSVMDATAERLGAACSPLVCVSGQMSIACRLLLGSLVGQGVEVRYHGDFDWGGLEIGNAVMRLGARPWRFGSQDYRDAVVAAGADGLRGRPVTATWDPALSATMREMGMAVVEEAVLDDLRADLEARNAPASSPRTL
ncbi:MAG: hypothetical protein QOE72_1891 [Chloroflexota bacterium]|nr:hypothetical protein [Chloroflexota bacterium]